jgi:uncharacterized membrane protein
MQASLALGGFLLALLEARQSSNWRWTLGVLVLVANWPYTMICVMPINKALMAINPAEAGPEARPFIEKWARLHAVRTVPGFVATLLFLWVALD